jgi:hypothetical protein
LSSSLLVSTIFAKGKERRFQVSIASLSMWHREQLGTTCHSVRAACLMANNMWQIAALGALLLPRTSGFARQWPRGRLPKAIEDIKNWLISSMYATAQKRRHINGILEKLSIAKKFSREYMLL